MVVFAVVLSAGFLCFRYIYIFKKNQDALFKTLFKDFRDDFIFLCFLSTSKVFSTYEMGNMFVW